MKRLVFSLIYATVVLLCTAVPAQGVPRLINYQGILTDDTGNPLDGSYQLTFRIYETTQAATPLWSEAHATQVSNGLFNVILGGVTALPDGLFDADERWLSIQIDSEPEMYPWIRLTSVAWALRAAVADAVSGGVGDGHSLDADDGSPVDAVYVGPDGYVGMGTTTPSENLVIGGDWGTSAPGNRAVIFDSSADVQTGLLIGDHTAAYGFLLWATANDVFRLGTVNDGTAHYTLNTSWGNVGIGITTPAEKLHVAGVIQTDGFKMPTGATDGWVLTSNASGVGTWQPGGGVAGDGDWTISGSDLYSSVSGNVGIGTSTPSAKLDVVGDGRVVRALASGNRAAVEAKHSASENLAYLADATAGVRGISIYGAGVFAQSDSVALVAENTSTIRTNAYLAGEKAVYGESATGNVGYLGGGVFGVYGEEVINGNYGGVGYWQYAVLGHSENQVGVLGRSPNGTGVWGSSTSGTAGYFSGDVVVVDGDLTTPVLEITGGSDLSEGFDIRDPEGGTPAPGMVVCVDPARPGQLMVSRAAYDTRVAGVISGAGGVRPGLLMGQKGSTASGGSPVALTGRVYCLADASGGAIVPGDLLTTSNTAGHAMKASDRERSHGAIIGKAMTPLENGRGLVLVLVSLQ